MRSIRSFFITLSGMTFVAIIALFTASLGLLVAGMLSVLMLGHALSAWLAPKPVAARARPRDRQTPARDYRVWNDGKGTIIDM